MNKKNEEKKIISDYKISDTKNIFSKYDITNTVVKNFSVVPNKKLARKISIDILESLYGPDSMENIISFDVKFDSEYHAWVVSGELAPNFLGGIPTVIIRKKDAKVLAIHYSR